MFTGIVEELGEVLAVEDQGDASRLTVRGPLVTSDARHGDSIAVNGVCLTVTGVRPDDPTAGPADGVMQVWTTDVMAETLRRSSLGTAREGDPVNLERAVTPQTRLGGHLVQGHVDGVGVVLSRTPAEHWEVVRIALPPALARYVVEKGSITVDGVSLTVSAVGDDWFEVSLIPTTLGLTTLGRRGPGAGQRGLPRPPHLVGSASVSLVPVRSG